MDKLLSVKEIAIFLGRSPSYVYHLKMLGLVMIGGRTTIAEVRKFEKNHPSPCAEYRKNREKASR